jgi:archaellum biogenesis ATPase FlaH
MTQDDDAPQGFQGLPALPAIIELQQRDQWVARTMEKHPIDANKPLGFSRASVSNPSTWASYEQAEQLAMAKGYPGVGYVLNGDYAGFDLDKQRSSIDGEWSDLAKEVLALAETYTEVSPSGLGLRLFARDPVDKAIKANPIGVEIYSTGRYLTVTGNHVPGTPTSIKPAPKTLALLLERYEAFRAEREAAADLAPSSAVQVIGTGFFRAVNEMALQRCGDWVPDIFGSAAKYQPATGAWRVSSRFLGRDLEEDLSISPLGIKDWGVADMGDPRGGARTAITLVMDFLRIPKPADAAFYLCKRMGVMPESLGWEVRSSGSLSHGQDIAKALLAENKNQVDQKKFLEWQGDLKPVINTPYLIKGLIDRGTMSVVYGPSNSGKTFFVLDLAYHIASGMPWRGIRVHGAGVLYLAAEGGNGVINRMTALTIEHGVLDTPLALRRASLDLFQSKPDIEHLLALTKEAEEKAPIGLIVIDTLSRVMAGGDENDTADMNAFVANMDAIREITQAHILVVHHTGKDATRGARGSNALLGAIDTEIAITVDEMGSRKAVVIKQRDHANGQEYPFELKPIELGIDEDGDPVSTCVVAVAGAAPRDNGKGLEKQKGYPSAISRVAMFAAMQEAWNIGNPLSFGRGAAITQERYAPRVLSKLFGVVPGVAEACIRAWIDDGLLQVETVNKNTKKKGLQVLRTPIEWEAEAIEDRNNPLRRFAEVAEVGGLSD